MELKLWNVTANAPGPDGEPVPFKMELRGPHADAESAIKHVATHMAYLTDVKAELPEAPKAEEVK